MNARVNPDLTPETPKDAAAEAVSAIPQAELDALTDKPVEAFKSRSTPEIPADIYELGLIYGAVDAQRQRAT